jgi:hypothetical protein
MLTPPHIKQRTSGAPRAGLLHNGLGAGHSGAPAMNFSSELAPVPPADPRTATLLDLLRVLAEVRGAFERMGRRALPALRRAARDTDPKVRARARQLLLDRERRRAVRRLARYAARAHHELEAALFLLARHHSPGADMRPYRLALDAMGDELAQRVGKTPRGRRRAAVLVEYLAEEIGFAGPTEDYHHPDHIHLHRAIERRAGMPLTLCAIYAAVARRAGLRTGLLPMPGHVLLEVDDGGERVVLDPFGRGRVVSRERAVSYLAGHGVSFRDEWFEPAPDGQLFLRHVLNLINSCKLRGRPADARELELVLRVLAQHPAIPDPR